VSDTLEPVQNQSLHQACVRSMEAKILSGEWSAGKRLRSERTLAAELKVSRPVVHHALVDLAAKGLVRIVPRRGVYVNDYRTSGSLTVLSTLLAYQAQEIDLELMYDLIEARKVIETDTARLAARNRTTSQLKRIAAVIDQEQVSDSENSSLLTELDFNFHLEIALSSGNRVYPMILNSFRSVYTHLTGRFFTVYKGSEPVQRVFSAHKKILEAIREQEPEKAAELMAAMLDEGAEFLLKIGG